MTNPMGMVKLEKALVSTGEKLEENESYVEEEEEGEVSISSLLQ